MFLLRLVFRLLLLGLIFTGGLVFALLVGHDFTSLYLMLVL